MDAPPIQYCQTVDGVNIAYWTLGDGPPLLYVNTPLWSHAELIWHLSAFREFLSGIGRGRRLIYFDPRSCGLSDGTPPTSFHAWQPDVSAVLDAAGVARTSIAGAELATKAAVIFAAQNNALHR